MDAFYFAVATLTTTSVSDPDLVLDERWMKVFTVFYLLIGIGILCRDPSPARDCVRHGPSTGANGKGRGEDAAARKHEPDETDT